MGPDRAILSIYFRHQRGGLCERLELFLRHFADQGWSAHYCSIEPFPWHQPRMVHHHVPAPPVAAGPWFWLGFAITAPWVLLHAAWRSRAECIVVFDLYYALLALPTRWLLGCRLLVSVHADTRVVHELQGRAGWVRWADAAIEAIGLRWADAVHTVSATLARTLEARHPRLVGRVTHLPNDIRLVPAPAPDLVSALRRPVPTIVTASILDRRKNVAFLLDALAELQDDPWRLIVVGDGPERANLERQARVSGIGDRVELTGWKSDVRPYLAAADVFVLPSIHEGNPLALLEALGAGLVCLGSDIPEIREVLMDERLLFPLTDATVLAGRLRDLVRDPAQFARARATCRSRAESFRFDWPSAMYRWATVGASGT